jgi:cytoskeletal protein CcmA (bactofilin family)
MGMSMFGQAKPLNARDRRAVSNTVTMTGLERAKLERIQEAEVPRPPQPSIARSSAVVEAAPRPAPEPVKSMIMPAPRPAAAASLKPVPLAASSTGNAAHLYAGPGIMLKGEIVGCDTLRVEGTVDGDASARQLVICQGGRFLGTAEIEEAEIEGSFEGTLCVHGHLLLRSNGRISGKLSYGQIEVEKGGEIVGEINAHDKQLPAMPTPQPLVSVSNQRRALATAPVPQPAPFEVERALRYEEAPRAEPAPAPSVVQMAPVSDAANKTRKPLFFGRG